MGKKSHTLRKVTLLSDNRAERMFYGRLWRLVDSDVSKKRQLLSFGIHALGRNKRLRLPLLLSLVICSNNLPGEFPVKLGSLSELPYAWDSNKVTGAVVSSPVCDILNAGWDLILKPKRGLWFLLWPKSSNCGLTSSSCKWLIGGVTPLWVTQQAQWFKQVLSG